MTLGVFLLILAGLFALFDVVLGRAWGPDRYARARWLTPVAVLLLVAALLVGVEPFVNT